MRFACFEAIFFLDWNSFFFFVWNTIVILFRIFEIFLGRFILKRMIISRILFLIKSYTFYYFFSRWRRKLLLLLSMKWKSNLVLVAKCYLFFANDYKHCIVLWKSMNYILDNRSRENVSIFVEIVYQIFSITKIKKSGAKITTNIFTKSWSLCLFKIYV